MKDDRLQYLIGYLQQAGDGFANNCVMKPELLAALQELQQYRDSLDMLREAASPFIPRSGPDEEWLARRDRVVANADNATARGFQPTPPDWDDDR